MDKGAIKKLDGLLGPLFYRALSARPKKRGQFLAPGDVGNILVVRPGGMGDAVLLIPLLHFLEGYFTGAKITVLAEKRNAGAFYIEDKNYVVHCYDEKPLATFAHLKRQKWDLAVDTEQFHHASTLYANALGPRFFAGFDTLNRGRFLTHCAPYSEDDYEVHSFLALAKAITGKHCPFDPELPFVVPNKLWEDWAEGEMGGGNFVAVAPSAGAAHRTWPIERLMEVCDGLASEGYSILVVGGSDAVAPAKALSARLPGKVASIAGRANLGQTSSAIKRSKALLVADTGLLHIAVGVGTPTVSLFGSGLMKKWGPIGRLHVKINKNLPCSPCTTMGTTPPCPIGASCLDLITAGEVLNALKELLPC